MPDKLQELMLNRPPNITGDVQYPKPGDPGVVDDKFMRGLGVATGIDAQQPGDLAGFVGATAGLVGPSILSRLSRAVRPLVAAKRGMAAESAMSRVAKPTMRLEELDPRISGLEPPAPATAGIPKETTEEKMLRLIYERMDRRNSGMRDPRVPRLNKE